MRRAVRLGLVLGAAAFGVGGCAGGDAGGVGGALRAPGGSKPCRLLARLAATADKLERADLADPTGFQRALDAAVAEYVATIKELRAVTPASLRADIDQLQAAVEQYRFQDALAPRSALDSYADATCGLGSSTTTSPSR